MTTTVRFDTADQIMTVVLDGPDSMNSLTPTVLDGLTAAPDAAENDHTRRGVVITGRCC
jgi:enoyl-CoA hydratase/carnithine racemase